MDSLLKTNRQHRSPHPYKVSLVTCLKQYGKVVGIGTIDYLVGTRGLVGNETDALHLASIVESEDPDEGVGVLLFAFLNLLCDLGGVGAAEHGKLPHGPVAAIVVSRRAVVRTVDESDLNSKFVKN
jgi:hypothetical protein